MCECNVPKVAVQKRKAVSLPGVLSAIAVIAGLIVMLANVIAGALLLLVGIGLAFFGKKTVFVCPNCGEVTEPKAPPQEFYG